MIDDYTFRNTKLTISKGILVWIPVFPIHHDPNIYPDPEKFDPERFTEDKIKERNLMHYFPFGHGPRNCIGTYNTNLRLNQFLNNDELIKLLHIYIYIIEKRIIFPFILFKFN